MATPKIITDGTTELKEAELNKFVAADDAKVQCKMNWAHVRYNGTAWEVVSGEDKAGIASLDLSWDGVGTALDITLSGFSNPPIAVVCPASASAVIPKVKAVLANKLTVEFYDFTGAEVTTEGTTMDFNVILIGE